MIKRHGLLILDDDRYFQHLNVIEKIQDYGHTLLTEMGRAGEYHGACPFEDCSADTDGFMAWDALTKHSKHWHCRSCHRSGRLEHLVMALEGVDFWEACRMLEIPEHVPEIAIPRRRQEKPVPDWQKIELAFLEVVYPAAWRDLARERGSAYLAQRGILRDTASRYGVGYLRPFEEIAPDQIERIQEAVKKQVLAKYPDLDLSIFRIRANYLRRWFDSIVYPVSIDRRGNQGYASRTLRLWRPGMDEHEHKALLEQHNSQVCEHNRGVDKKQQRPLIARHLATHQRGFFNGAALAHHTDVIFVEGLFDALALLDADIPNVVDISGVDNFKEIASRVLPASVSQATLAYDGDSAGLEAIETLSTYCRYHLGFTPRKCLIPADGMGKDWNERYRKHGLTGLACLLNMDDQAQASATLETAESAISSNPDNSEVIQVDASPLVHAPQCSFCEHPLYVTIETGERYCKAHWRAQGHAPAPGEECCVCGDFVDLEGDDERLYCSGCYAKKCHQSEAGKSAFFASVNELASVFEDGCKVEEPTQELCDYVASLPTAAEFVDERAPLTSLQDRVCPFCAQAGRKASGIVVIPGKYHNQDECKSTPEKPFYYAWIDKERVWWCPGCKNIQRSLPARRGQAGWAA